MNAWRFQTTAGLSDASSKMELRADAVVIASATELPGRDRAVFVPLVSFFLMEPCVANLAFLHLLDESALHFKLLSAPSDAAMAWSKR
jgi:hypothetical protein